MFPGTGKGLIVTFELWRQDDNGNRFLVDAFIDLVEAEYRLAELSRNPHKQTYWISENSDEMLHVE